MFITGYSLRAPRASNASEFARCLEEGVDMTSPSRRYPAGYHGLPPRTGTLDEIDKFDHKFFRFSQKQVDKMDIGIRLLLETTHEALLDARLSTAQLAGSRTGVYVGHCFSDYLNRASQDEDLTGYELVNGAHAMAANKISFFYDLKGPSLVVDTACSSSLVALDCAVADLQAGKIDRAIVGGISLTLDPAKNATFNAFTMLSPDGRCYTFDTRANGYCRAEGIATIILESPRVRSHGYAVVLGSAVNSDGFKKKGITYPSGQDQAANARAVFERAGVDPASIGYIEAHGTGTVAGDSQELQGLTRVFYGDEAVGSSASHQGPHGGGVGSGAKADGGAEGEEAAEGEGEGDAQQQQAGGSDALAAGVTPRAILIGSVKSNMGHAEGASGLMSLIKCLLMYEKRKVFGNLNYREAAHAQIRNGLFNVVAHTAPWQPANVCISNYGFGGTNAFVVLGPGNFAYPPPATALPLAPAAALTFSNNKTPAAAQAQAAHPAFVQQQIALGNHAVYAYRNGTRAPQQAVTGVCFVYGGQGSQWNGMGKALMTSCPEFRGTIERLGAALLEAGHADLDLVRLFEDGSKWMDKRFTAIGLTAYQIAATNVLRAAGITATHHVGHSLGETATGYGAGVQSERESILIAQLRAMIGEVLPAGQFLLEVAPGGRAYDSAPKYTRAHGTDRSASTWYVLTREEAAAHAVQGGEKLHDLAGAMAAVGLPAADIQRTLDRLGFDQTRVACLNAPAGQTVSGPALEVARLHAALQEEHPQLFWRDIDTDGVAYHAPYLRAYRESLEVRFGDILGDRRVRPLQGSGWIPTSGLDESGQLPANLDAAYHAANITGAVHFQQAVERLPPGTLLVEVGPSKGILSQAKRVRADLSTLGLVARAEPDSEAFLSNTALLVETFWKAGVAPQLPSPDLSAQLPVEARQLTDLWDHAKQHRVFRHDDFITVETLKASQAAAAAASGLRGSGSAAGGSGSSGSGAGVSVEVSYDLRGAHAFLMDHVIRGKALFPATGHAFTIWQALGTTAPLRIRNLEITFATVMDASSEARLAFEVRRAHDKVSVLHKGQEVARATVYVPEDASAAADGGASLLTPLPAAAATAALDDAAAVRGAELYPSLRRLGYDYEDAFRLIEHRQVTPARHVAASLRGAPHVIAYLDNLLQAMLDEDPRLLMLPVLVREVVLTPTALTACRAAGRAVFDRTFGRVCGAAGAEIRGLMTLPSAPLTKPKLLHLRTAFVPVTAATAVGTAAATEDIIIALLRSELNSFVAPLPLLVRSVALAAPAPAATAGDSAAALALAQLEGAFASVAEAPVPGKPATLQVLPDDAAAAASAFVCPDSLFVLAPGSAQARDLSAEGYVCVLDRPAAAKLWRRARAVSSTDGGDDDGAVWTASWQELRSATQAAAAAAASSDAAKRRAVVFAHVGAHGLVRSLSREQDASHVVALSLPAESANSNDAEGALKALPADVRAAIGASPMRFLAVEEQQQAASLVLGYRLALPDNGSIDIAAAGSAAAGAQPHFQLSIERPGDLSTVFWREAPGSLRPDCRIAVAALNFKDVMYSMGKLRLERPCFGLEFSGWDVATGARVMGIASEPCIASETRSAMRWPVPEGMSLEDAATVPVVYLTSAYSLFHKAGLRAGMTALIHAGTGGIGHSAIHLCQRAGVRVLATCAPQKQAYLAETFGLDAACIASSRDTSFVDMVLQQTGGAGVDCVLNSLSGDCMAASLEVVKPHGHFCEIGKFDLQNNTHIGLKALEQNVSYHAIDLATMFESEDHRPLLQALLLDLLAKDWIKPLPWKAFTADETVAALRYLAAGKHRGKVLINMRDFVPPTPLAPSFRADAHGGVHLVTGGLGGFGLELASWLLDNGATRVALVGRSGVRTGWQLQRVAALRKRHGEGAVVVRAADVADAASARALLASEVTWAGVWHSAGVLRDGLFKSMEPAAWEEVCHAKVAALRVLDEVTTAEPALLAGPLVVFSSIASLMGNLGQTAYALANQHCERIIERRCRRLGGVAGVSIQWGAIDNVGMAVATAQKVKQLGSSEILFQNVDASLDSLHHIMRAPGTVSSYLPAPPKKAKSATEGGAGAGATKAVTAEDVTAKVAEVLGADVAELEADVPLSNYGLDSLSSIEIVSWINARVAEPVAPDFLGSTATIKYIADHLAAHGAVTTVSADGGGDGEAGAGAGAGADASSAGAAGQGPRGSGAGAGAGTGAGSPSATPVGSTPAASSSDEDDDSLAKDSAPPTRPATPGAAAGLLPQGRPVGLPATAPSAPPQLLSVSLPETLQPELFSELRDALARRPRFLVIEQRAADVFNHGAPIDDKQAAQDPDYVPKVIADYVGLSAALRDARETVIVVRIDGSVRGGGMLFPALGDVVVATERSTFGLPEIHRRMVPGVVSSALRARMAPKAVMHRSLTGAPFGATEALRLGLVDQVLADGDREWQQLLRRLRESDASATFVKANLTSGDAEAMGTVMGDWFAETGSGNASAARAGAAAAGQQQQQQQQQQDAVITELRTLSFEEQGEDGSVLVMTLCDHEGRNTFSERMSREMDAMLPVVARYRALVVRSALPHFHVGVNPHQMRAWRDLPRTEVARRLKSMYASFLRLFQLPVPVVAVLNGRVYGGGLPLALWADYRVATSDLDLHLGNVTRGMSPAAQLSELLTTSLSVPKVMGLYLTNAHWTATDCLREGIVASVHDTQPQAVADAVRLATFLAAQAANGITETRKFVKPTLDMDRVNAEAWAIAGSIVGGHVFTNIGRQNESFESSGITTLNTTTTPAAGVAASATAATAATAAATAATAASLAPAVPVLPALGIVELEVVCPEHCVLAPELEAHGIPAKSKYLQNSASCWDVDEDAISLAMTAVARLVAKLPADTLRRVQRLEVGTESNVDMAKSIKTYLTELLPHSSETLGVDNVNACFGGAAALMNTLDWLRARVATGAHGSEGVAYGIVVATDTATVEGADLAFMGAGAVAMLVGPDPCLEILPHPVPCMKNTEDFLKPRPSGALSPYIRGRESMDHYVDALQHVSARTREKFGDEWSLARADHALLHGGMCASVLVRAMNKWASWERVSRQDLLAKYEAGMQHGAETGALYTASLFFAVHSMLEHARPAPGTRVLMFAYGSGSTGALMRAVVRRAPRQLTPLAPFLASRMPLSFAAVQQVLDRQRQVVQAMDMDLPAPRLGSKDGRYLLLRIPAGNERRRYKQQGK